MVERIKQVNIRSICSGIKGSKVKLQPLLGLLVLSINGGNLFGLLVFFRHIGQYSKVEVITESSSSRHTW